MKAVIHISILLFLFSSCAESPTQNSSEITSAIQPDTIKRNTNCNFLYDTISNPNYAFHILLLKKHNSNIKQGMVYPEGDKWDTAIWYDQDITMFVEHLDPNETGIYYRLTNKVIFLIVENEPRMLSFGLTRPPINQKQDYFLKHLSNPSCNSISIDSIYTLVQENMDESRVQAKIMKQRILNHLKR